MNMKIVTTRGVGMGPLPTLLERMASERAVERAFSRSGMPQAIIDDLEKRVPFISMLRLFEEAAHQVGDRAFGLRVGLGMDHGAYGIWAQYLCASSTLAGAIRRSIRTISAYQDGGRMSLRHEADYAIWAYHPPKIGRLRFKQHSDHVLPAMINVARRYLGPTWLPEWAELDYPSDESGSALEDCLHVNIRFGRCGIGIAFKEKEIYKNKKMNDEKRKIITSDDLDSFYKKGEEKKFINRIEDLIRLRLLDGETDIEGLARSLDVSKRRLQSELRLGGAMYRDILLKVRMEKSLMLLNENNHSITEIAYNIGYEELSSFSRAFCRWYGCYPTDFRRSSSPGSR
jgi:AraC-like DNA-binding protein